MSPGRRRGAPAAGKYTPKRDSHAPPSRLPAGPAGEVRIRLLGATALTYSSVMTPSVLIVCLIVLELLVLQIVIMLKLRRGREMKAANSRMQIQLAEHQQTQKELRDSEARLTRQLDEKTAELAAANELLRSEKAQREPAEERPDQHEAQPSAPAGHEG